MIRLFLYCIIILFSCHNFAASVDYCVEISPDISFALDQDVDADDDTEISGSDGDEKFTRNSFFTSIQNPLCAHAPALSYISVKNNISNQYHIRSPPAIF